MRRLASLLSLCVALASITFVAAQTPTPVYALIGAFQGAAPEDQGICLTRQQRLTLTI